MRGEYNFQLEGWHDQCEHDPWEAQIFLNIETAVDGSPHASPSEASTLGHFFLYVQLLKKSLTQHYKEIKENLQDGLLTVLFKSLPSINGEPYLSTRNINFFTLGPSHNFSLRNSSAAEDHSRDNGDGCGKDEWNEEGDDSAVEEDY